MTTEKVMIGLSQHLRISWESKWWWCHDMHWGWMQTAYHTMVDGHQILVDYNRQQLMPGWIPRRLGNAVSYLEPKGMIWQMFQPCMWKIFLMLPIIFLWWYLFNPNQNINNRVCNLDWCFPWCWIARTVQIFIELSPVITRCWGLSAC
jgi:hypothetical protein